MLRVFCRCRRVTTLPCGPWLHRPSLPRASPASPGPGSSWASSSPLRSLRTAPATVKLRPYQEECVQTVLDAFEQGRRRVGLSLATGGGKTVIFTELIGRVRPPTPKATKTLILVHRRELVEQALRHCSARYPHARVEMELGSTHASGTADITVASVQSINSRGRIAKFRPDEFKLVLVDEAHHIVAGSYLKVLGHFGLLSDDETASSSKSTPALVGVSATFSRHDGLALGKAIKHIVYHKDYIDMIGEKWLSDVIFTTVQSGADLSRVRKGPTGDFAASSLSQAVNRAQTNEIVVRAWLAKAAQRRSTLVFCVDVQHLLDLAAAFRRHGRDARSVTATTPSAERAATIDAFKAGEFPVLLNCGVFTEGTDIPNIDCVLLARPTRSRNLLVQMIGRGMRLHPGKRDCHVLDMVASLADGIITVPSLFGLDPAELVDAANPSAMRAQHQRAKDAAAERLRAQRAQLQDLAATSPSAAGVSGDGGALAARDVNVRFTDYDSITDLVADTSGERHVRALSQHAWVCISAAKFVLTNGAQGSFLTIERAGDSSPSSSTNNAATTTTSTDSSNDDDPPYTVKYTVPSAGIAPTKSPYLRPRTIATAHTFESAVHAADTFAAERFVRAFVLLRGPLAAWRASPATPLQLGLLERAFRDAPRDRAGLTKGGAADMLIKLKHGARGTFRALQRVRAAQARVQAKRDRDEAWRADEGIDVGPLPSVQRS